MDLQALAPNKKIVTAALGDPSAPIVFIGDSPSPSDIAKGTLGSDVLKVLKDVFPDSITESDYFYFNAIPFLVPKTKDSKKNLEMSQKAALKCHEYVNWVLAKHPRSVVVCLGNTAVWALTGSAESKITRIRGQVMEHEGLTVMPSVHPSYLMRGSGSYQKFKRDINYALDIARGTPRLEWAKPDWSVAASEQDVHEFVAATAADAARLGDDEIGADIETSGFDFLDDRILCLGWCVDPAKAYIVPDKYLHVLEEYPEFYLPRRGNGQYRWTWHNGKFDVKFLRQRGMRFGVDEDTMLMSYAMEERGGFHDLDQVAADELGAPYHKEMLDEYLPSKSSSYAEIPEPVLWEYLAYDVSKTKGMSISLRARVRADSANEKNYTRVLMEASELLADVETNGMLVDMEARERNVKEFTGIMQEHHATLNEEVLKVDPNASYKTSGPKRDGGGRILAGINPNSPKQLGTLIYDKLRLAKVNKGTGADILDKLPAHPVVNALKKYRKAAKAYGTYVKPLPEQVSSDGRVHSTYLIHGTATGRLSSRGPNMQNQPRDPRIRGQFKAAPGYRLCEMDLDQAELRCLAALSGDAALCYIYETEGLSLHKEVSVDLWGEDWKERYAIDEPGNPVYDQAKEEYMRTKAVNFGIVYGREAPSIADEFEMPIPEAQLMIDGWANKFPDAWRFIGRCRNAPLKGQNLLTPFGRRKRSGVVAREKIRDLQNEAANFPHQSIASDITLLAAVEVRPWLIERDIKIVNLVHDAIIVEYPDDDALFVEMARHVTSVMERIPVDWGIDRIPFSADAKTGDRWGNLKDTPFK